MGAVPDTSLIKTRDRVRDLAEVFTPAAFVESMLDLPGVKEASQDVWKTFLEPACGNGNFLIAILKRKLAAFHAENPRCRQETLEFNIVGALSTVYGIDISRENVVQARARMVEATKEFYLANRSGLIPSPGFWEAVGAVLDGTIVWGNSLEGASTTELTEFIPERKSSGAYTKRFRTQKYTLADLYIKNNPNPVQLRLQTGLESPRFPRTAPVYFLELGTTALVGEVR
jgi:hypothetical protein